MKKYIFVALGLVAAIAYHLFTVSSLKTQLTESLFYKDSVIQLHDSSMAALASERMDKDALQDALSAEKELNGQLIAAARVRFQGRTVRRDSVAAGTEVRERGERYMAVHDTTEAGVLDAEITAPPYPENLLFSYEFSPAPIEATVSVVQMKDNSAVFAVRYRGGETQIEAPFARLPKRERFITPYVEALYSVTTPKNVAVRAGTQMRLPLLKNLGVYGTVEAQQMFGDVDAGSVYVGVRKVF